MKSGKNSHLLKEGKKINLSDGEEKTVAKIKKPRAGSDEDYFKLTELLGNSRIIYQTRTVFPFDFFPDDLLIDKDKVALITKYFFYSTRQRSILIRNISDVYVDTAILFATLYITDKYFADNPIKVDYLKKKDAVRARDIIQGLIICHEEKVDISEMNRGDVLPYLEEIGKATAH